MSFSSMAKEVFLLKQIRSHGMLNLTRTEKIQMGQVKGKLSEFLPVLDLRALHIPFIRQVKGMMDCINENLGTWSVTPIFF